MAIVIQPYRQEHEAAVQDFNRRLQGSSGDPNFVFSQSAVPRWLPPSGNNPVWNEFYVAIDGSTKGGPTVRGVYALKQEVIFVRGKGLYRIGCYHHPLSEGIVDRSFASVGALLARDALAQQPLLYALGMGGMERSIAKMLKALGFSLTPIPFYFRVVHPTRFLREMRALRTEPWRASLMNLAAATGAGWLAVKSAQAAASLRSKAPNASADFTVEEGVEFSDWADELWAQAKETVSFATVRDANTLRLLYPPDFTSNIASARTLRISRNGSAIGWAIIGQRRKDPKFGEMRVGSIVDCWALPENAATVIRAATQSLEKDDVDLIVSNQSHHAWCAALEKAGFLKGPSTFIFAASKKLTELLQPLQDKPASFHITRADGDGLPVNF
ncbi:MAG: hypothetical protein WA213_06255 [Terriglobales bacterium]